MIKLKRYLEPTTHFFIIAILLVLLIVCVIIVAFLINNQNTFLDSFLGALLGLIGALVIYELSLHINEINNSMKLAENTSYVYGLYRIELERNTHHLNNLIEKRWVPFYRLHTHTRDKLWGELAGYSKDLNFMKRINVLYGEYELINNKFDIMNAVRLQLRSNPFEEMSGVSIPEDISMLKAELDSQLDGCIGLGKKANKMAEGCLQTIEKSISELNSQ